MCVASRVQNLTWITASASKSRITDSQLTELWMYDSSDDVTLDNGIGNSSDLGNVWYNIDNRLLRRRLVRRDG